MNTLIAKITSGGKRDVVPLIALPSEDQENDVSSAITNGTLTQDEGACLRTKLRFFYMSPCWKWHLKRQFPWKAWFQFLKIIIVTTQLILFGIERQSHVIFISESNITFHHLFIRGWSSADETLPYPRASGDFAVYTNQDFLDSIQYAVDRFNNLTDISLGLFDFHDHSTPQSFNSTPQLTEHLVKLCINRFRTCQIDPTRRTYQLDPRTEDICWTFNVTNHFDIEEHLNETFNYCGLNLLTLEFAIHAIQLKHQNQYSLPDCYHFLVRITFDNNARTGKIRQHLDSQAQFRTCNQQIIHQNSTWTSVRRNLFITFDFVVVFISVLSCVVCLRSLWHGHNLCRQVRVYYATKRSEEKSPTWRELQVFYSFWYFLMIITDLMVIPGTIIKLGILFKITDQYNTAGLLLGLSSLFSWISILRYLSFFRKYNLLFITIQKALPLLLRFLVCSLIIFFGFMFCGWIVLGPYHTKFRTLSTTFETMYSLINGDDMYTTFANLETESFYLWLFSEIYLYSFTCLFIYVVSSLIIALIIDGYDSVKKYYSDGFPKSRLQKFSEEDILQQTESTSDWYDLTTAIEAKSVCFPCCFRTPKELSDTITRDTYLARNINT